MVDETEGEASVPAGGNVVPRPIEDEMRTSYIDYAMSVIVGRALPDARDGLKPVHRRILYAMNDMGLTHDKPYRKSALVVGEVLGKYHPHGDTAVYDAMVRMAQEFSLRYPLIDGQGNFGSVDGDNAAAMRYTEARLSKIAAELLEDIDKETVDFTDNYDASRKEPLVLPGKLPNLLLNGSSGIAVGMATNMPPHQLGEIVDGIKAVIENPNISFQDLWRTVPGPDFPTGGVIHGRQGIYDAYATGRGVIKIRARLRTEDHKDRTRIIVTELPYQVNKSTLLENMAELVKEKKLEDISDLRDESDRDGMRVVIELKRGAIPDVVINNLFKHTALESSFGILNLALVANEPKVLTLKSLIEQYIAHRVEVVTRRTQYLLRKAEERAHIVAGLIAAVDHLDDVIAIIRASADAPEARQALVARRFMTQMEEGAPMLPLDEEQAKAILDLRLSKLTGLEVTELKNELLELRGKMYEYRAILAAREKVLEVVVKELDEIKSKFNDERKTGIVDDSGDLVIEDLIPDENVVVMITNAGYIKRIPIDAYRTQGRGGKGLIGMQTKDEDYVVDLFTTTTHRYVLFFTNKGRVHWLKAYAIPEGDRYSKGKAIVNLLQGLDPDEKVAAAIPVGEFSPDRHLLFATKMGTVKKTALDEYSRPRVTGIIALGLDPGDELIGVGITGGHDEIVLAKAQGKSIRFHEENVRPMGRSAVGVKGVECEEGDDVVSLAILRDPKNCLLTVTENGYGKRSTIDEYRTQGRGGSGIITIQTSERNGRVVAVKEVAETDEVIVTSTRGMVIRIPVATVSILGRNTQGNRIMRLDEADKVMALAVLAQVDPVAPESQQD
ncbi:MAG: DNA gyrase subunit A [Thermoplasmatota archaeon]